MALVAELKRRDVRLTTAAASSVFRASARERRALSEREWRETALGFLSEYVSAAWLARVARRLGLEDYGVRRHSALDELVSSGGGGGGFGAGFAAAGAASARAAGAAAPDKAEPAKKKARASVAQARLAKTNTKGMAAISSFFGKK